MSSSGGNNPMVQVLPKSQITIPLASSREISDTRLFEQAQDETKRYYLPRYRLAEETVSGQQRFRVTLQQNEQGGQLTIDLEKYPAPELGLDFRNAEELQHKLVVKLRFMVALGNAGRSPKELSFSITGTSATGATLTLDAADLNQLTQLYQAMSEASYESVLLIERQVNVAIPVANAFASIDSPLMRTSLMPQALRSVQSLVLPLPAIAATAAVYPNPTLRFAGVNEIEVRGERYRRFDLRIDNWNAYPDALFTASPDLPPCGLNKESARTWVDILDQDGRRLYGYCALRTAATLQQLSFSLPIAQNPPLAVSIVLRDRRDNLSYQSNSVATPVDISAGHNIQLIVPTRGKAQSDTLRFDEVLLRNVRPGDKISILLEFPDQPQIPVKVSPEDGQRTRLSIGNKQKGAPSPWIQPAVGTATADRDLECTLESAQLYGTPEGQIVGFEVAVSLPAQESKRRLHTVAITLEMPAMLVSFPLAANQTIPITIVRWQNLAAEAEPFFEVGLTSSVAHEAIAFVLDPSIHRYIYQDILVDPGKHFGLLRYQERWNGQEYFYFQDEAMRDVIYYLPDVFKLVRKTTPPYTPDLVVYFDTTDDGAQATLHYRALPVVNVDRLHAAEQVLKALLHNLPANTTHLNFKPLLLTDHISYKLSLPRSNSELGPFQERTNAQVSLRDGIQDAVTLDMEDFRTVFDAMLTPNATMFDGRVELTVDELPLPPIRVIAKMHDLAGDVLSITTQSESPTRQIVTLHNEIESPLRIKSLSVKQQTATGELDLLIENLAFPANVAAGETCIFTVVRAAVSNANEPNSLIEGSLLFDLSGVEVVPDRIGVWEAIIDPVIQSNYRSELQVKTSAGLFARNHLWALQVIFPGRVSVALTEQLLESKVAVYLPIRDYVLNPGADETIRYQLESVYETHKLAHVDWQKFSGEILFITDAQLPTGA